VTSTVPDLRSTPAVSTEPETGSTTPEAERTTPEAERTMPEAEGTTPETERTTPATKREISLGYLRRHAAPLITVGGLAGLGILSTSAFHVVTGRGLGPGAFGLLAAFLAIVNIAAIGASALQNSVAVVTADPETSTIDETGVRRLDSATIEALVLGGAATLAILVAAPLFADWLGTSSLAVYLAALTVIPSFLFSVALGRLQGAGRATAVSGYSTASQMLRLLLAIAVLAAGLGAVSVLFAVLIAIVAVAVAASWQTRRLHVRSTTRAFSRKSTVLILLTISFAWLTNIEIVLVRANTVEDVSGAFAAGAVLAKMILLVPTVLSLYLLPRFVFRKTDGSTVRYGINIVLGTVLAAGLAVAAAVAVLGDALVRLLFGAGYDLAADLLPWMAIAYLPWALAQGLLISLTAAASRQALAVLVAAAVVQWVAASLLLPDVRAMIAGIGVIGVVTTAALFVLHLRQSRTVVG
jgi:O-antigen/teichoic acid export membrane protein